MITLPLRRLLAARFLPLALVSALTCGSSHALFGDGQGSSASPGGTAGEMRSLEDLRGALDDALSARRGPGTEFPGLPLAARIRSFILRVGQVARYISDRRFEEEGLARPGWTSAPLTLREALAHLQYSWSARRSSLGAIDPKTAGRLLGALDRGGRIAAVLPPPPVGTAASPVPSLAELAGPEAALKREVRLITRILDELSPATD